MLRIRHLACSTGVPRYSSESRLKSHSPIFLRTILGADRCGMQAWLNATCAEAHSIAPASTTAGVTRNRQRTFCGTATVPSSTLAHYRYQRASCQGRALSFEHDCAAFSPWGKFTVRASGMNGCSECCAALMPRRSILAPFDVAAVGRHDHDLGAGRDEGRHHGAHAVREHRGLIGGGRRLALDRGL